MKGNPKLGRVSKMGVEKSFTSNSLRRLDKEKRIILVLKMSQKTQKGMKVLLHKLKQ